MDETCGRRCRGPERHRSLPSTSTLAATTAVSGGGGSAGGPASPSPRASVRLSGHLPSLSAALSPSGNVSASDGSAGSAAFAARCGALAATGARATMRLVGLSVSANPQAGQGPDGFGAGASAAATAVLATALGSLTPARSFDATSDERFKLGDPRGTASQTLVEALHADLAAAMGGKTPPGGSAAGSSSSFSSSSSSAVVPVSPADLVDVLVRALCATPNDPAVDVAESVSCVLAEIAGIAAKRPLFRVEEAPAGPAAAASTSSAPALALAKADLAWSFASRGLALHGHVHPIRERRRGDL